MLEAVGHPTAVNPDRALRREAARRGWPIRTFTIPPSPGEPGQPDLQPPVHGM
jgi:hypothetical protein